MVSWSSARGLAVFRDRQESYHSVLTGFCNFGSSRTLDVRSSVVSRAESLDLCDDLSEAPDRDKDFAHGVLLVQLGVLVDCDVSVGQGEGVMEGGSGGSTSLCLPDSRLETFRIGTSTE